MAWCFPVPAAWQTAEQLDHSVFGGGYTSNLRSENNTTKES